MASSSNSFSYTGKIVDYTVAQTGTYDITAFGAQGGSSGYGGRGGLGAEISADIRLTKGEVLQIVVGGAGQAGNKVGTGGGGGSFVTEIFNGTKAVRIPLVVVAGGGGGAGAAASGGAGRSSIGGGGAAFGGGGGGGSFDSGTGQVLAAGENSGNGSVTIDLLCFAEGTLIATPAGEVAVERLAVGDLVTALASLAAQRAMTHDPALHLVTDTGVRIKPLSGTNAGRYVFAVPANVTGLRLFSRTARPSDTVGPFLDDRRALGVLVGEIAVSNPERIMIDRHLTETDLTGWFGREAGPHRWTGGNAILPVTASDRPTLLEIDVVHAGPYPVEMGAADFDVQLRPAA